MNPVPLRTERAPEESGSTIVPLLTLALRMLGERMLLWAIALGAMGVWAYTALQPEPWRILAALGYSLSVLLPFLWRDRRGGGE